MIDARLSGFHQPLFCVVADDDRSSKGGEGNRKADDTATSAAEISFDTLSQTVIR